MRTNFGWSGKRSFGIVLGLAWACIFGVSPAKAQSAAVTQSVKPTWRLLTLEEGRLVVSAAWAFKQPAPGTQDCSHLIHAVYKNAGFEYPYDSSFELYEGNENFARVKSPHAGDLIVWPGHVGIVVDPVLHSFYSLVRTGLQEQDYEAPYWKSRGVPRFYRYKMQKGTVQSAAKVATDSPQLKNVRSQDGADPALEDPSSYDTKDNSALKRAPKTTSHGAELIYGPSIPSELADKSAAFQIPSSTIVAPGDKPPTREEISEGISELSDAAGNVLRTDDPLKGQLPVVIVEQFKVERVEIKRDRGWARLEIDSKVSISGGTVQLKPRREEVRWELRRTEAGWESVAPVDRTYVAHDVAVKNLSAQLARLTASGHTGAHQEKARRQESVLANMLSALLSK
jgi:hypothetical protein